MRDRRELSLVKRLEKIVGGCCCGYCMDLRKIVARIKKDNRNSMVFIEYSMRKK